MPAPRNYLKTQKTVFIAVEGATELAFIEHLKSIYLTRNCGVRVTVKNSHGKGPSNVISKASKAQGEFNKRIALFDGDLSVPKEASKQSDERGIEQVILTPAIEAVLLSILGEKPTTTTATCKKKLATKFKGSFLEAGTYERHISKEMLEVARSNLAPLDRIISIIQGND